MVASRGNQRETVALRNATILLRFFQSRIARGWDELELRQAEEACRVNRADLTVANDLGTVKAGRHTIHLVRTCEPVESYGPPDDIAEKLVDRAFTWAPEKAR